MEDQIAQAPVELGKFLRSEREKRHVTIEQIASATKINIKLLHALENNHYEILPAKPFVRGFITSYLKYLRIEPREVLSLYDHFLDEKAALKYQRPENAPHIFVEKEGHGDDHKTALTIVMVAFLVIAGVAFAILKPTLKQRHGRSKKAPVSNEEIATVVPPPSEVSPVLATPEPVPVGIVQDVTPPPLKPSQVVSLSQAPTSQVSTASLASPIKKIPPIPPNEVKYLLVVRAIEDSWVKYQADDRPFSQFILKKDQKIFVRAKNSIRFVTGNPNGLEISNDNKEFQSLKGKPRLLILPKEAEEQFFSQPFIQPNPSYLSTGN